MTIQRVQNLNEEQFVNDFLLPKKPVIVTDAMKGWDLEKFQPAGLREQFGNYEVQIYDDLFDLQTIDTLEYYLDENFGKKAEGHDKVNYIRWYTKLKDVDFYWADEVFDILRSSWSQPSFLPCDSLVIPFQPEGQKGPINTTRYPYKGLFISGKGARTRLHRDPFNSNAVLFQFYGQKKMCLYEPSQETYVMNGGEFVDIENPDLSKFSDFNKAKCNYEDVLMPGEMVLFPGGWFHDVRCISDSISITWNFVHKVGLPGFYSFIEKYPNDSQMEIVRYFLKNKISADADVQEIISFLKSSFPE
ncbi:MAG: cupin-like domain-containing protein [Bacteroidetes bacterium]|nr:cupin-like domain-containing protein [Bacteroidota bacterium]